MTNELMTGPFERGMERHDFGRDPPRKPDPETATDEELQEYEEERDGYDERSGYDEDGELLE